MVISDPLQFWSIVVLVSLIGFIMLGGVFVSIMDFFKGRTQKHADDFAETAPVASYDIAETETKCSSEKAKPSYLKRSYRNRLK